MAVARLSCAEGEETRHAGASKWFTSFFGGAGYRAARDTLPGPGVGEHLHRVIGVRAKSVQNRAQCMADLRLSARLLLQNRAARLVQQLVPLHDPVNFVGRRRLPSHLDVLPGQGGARHVLRRGAWNCVVQIRRDQGMKIKLYRGEGRKERGRGKKREREWVGWGNDGVRGNSSGGGSDETGVWLPMRATANGATREFSVSRGNSRTKRGEVNWCRVDCFCVADWKARIPPSEWQLLEPRSGGAIDLSSLLLVIRKRVVCRCATMFATSGRGGESTVSLTAIGTPIFFHRVECRKGAKARHACRAKWIHRGFRGTRKAIPLPREETRSTVIRLEFSPPTSKAGRENGNATAEHFRFPLE